MMERGIETLYIWQEARAFVNNVYGMMAKCNDYGFRDQMQRAAVSIMNNIAEGSESGYDAKFIHFLHIAKGSCGEVKSMFSSVKISTSAPQNNEPNSNRN